ncbi:MAG: LeuA family protein [Caldisphaera sp.]
MLNWDTEKYWLTHYNWVNEVRSKINLPEKVIIHDATIREGQQQPGVAFKKDEIIMIAKLLDDLGVDRIELIPFLSKDDEDATKTLLDMNLNAKLMSFVSWSKEDIDLALKLDLKGIILDFVGNPWQGKVFWGLEPDEIIKKGVEAAEYAKEHGLYVVAMPWDDFKAPLEFVKKNVKSLINEGHVDRVTLCDTYGDALPWAMEYFIKEIKKVSGTTPIELHIHNDFGLATADALVGVASGIEGLHVTINGLGERVGLLPLEEAVVGLQLLLGLNTNIKLDKLYELSKIVEEISKVKIAVNKPIIGDNQFRFTAGWITWMHKKAKDAGKLTGMLPFLPDIIGRELKYTISKGSGSSFILEKLKDLGIEIKDPETIKLLTSEVKNSANTLKSTLPDNILIKIANDVLSKKNK